MMRTFSHNLKRFRLAKHLTQEQAAEALGVSTQAVSRWECATTLPDAAMLPEIARLYCVTIDDLYRETSVAYDNYAQRLGSVYETTRKQEDFVRADQEYRKLLKSGSVRTEDLRLYGILYQYRMEDCRDRALELFDRVLNQGVEADAETYWRTKRQKLYLMSQVGRGEEMVQEQMDVLNAHRDNVEEWICLIAACENIGKLNEARNWMEQAMSMFPENPCLQIYCGYVYAGLKQYEEAFICWRHALKLDPSFVDASYAMGFCLEEQGKYADALDVWTALADELEARGFDSEVNLPRERARECEKRI